MFTNCGWDRYDFKAQLCPVSRANCDKVATSSAASVFICGNNTLMTRPRPLALSSSNFFNEWPKKTLNNARHENENGKRNQPTFSQTMQLSINQTLEFLSSFLVFVFRLFGPRLASRSIFYRFPKLWGNNFDTRPVGKPTRPAITEADDLH